MFLEETISQVQKMQLQYKLQQTTFVIIALIKFLINITKHSLDLFSPKIFVFLLFALILVGWVQMDALRVTLQVTAPIYFSNIMYIFRLW